MNEGDEVRLRSTVTSDGNRQLAAGTSAWIIDVQGGGAGFVVQVPLDDDDAPFDTVYVDAAQIEPV